MSDGMVSLLDGNTFLVSSASGDIEATTDNPTGLFSYDTRYLSTWVLTVDGSRLSPLSVDDLQYLETRFFLVPGQAAVYVHAQVSVNPALPEHIGHLELLDIPGRWGRLDAYGRGRTQFTAQRMG
jgi:hypothetical protein